jgi:Protein of unknown function (DUF3768)
MPMPVGTVERTRLLNDNFRTTFVGGRLLTTASVAELAIDVKARLFLAVQSYASFSEADDPHREHDFGAVEIDGEKYFWKIDYYDLSQRFGSEDPSDPQQTTRVLTIMRADEY